MQTSIKFLVPKNLEEKSLFNCFLEKGQEVESNNDFQIKIAKIKKVRSDEGSVIVELLITWSTNIGSGIIANWLFEKLKGKINKVSIKNKNVPIMKKELQEHLNEIEEKE